MCAEKALKFPSLMLVFCPILTLCTSLTAVCDTCHAVYSGYAAESYASRDLVEITDQSSSEDDVAVVQGPMYTLHHHHKFASLELMVAPLYPVDQSSFLWIVA